MTLRNKILDDASDVFLNASDFAETVTYHPHTYFNATERASREVKAVVFREQLSVFTEDVETVIPMFEVHVANDSTAGISSDEIDLGGDQISLPLRDGKAAERRAITELLTQDNGMLVLRCR